MKLEKKGAAHLKMRLRSEPTHQASKEPRGSGETLHRGYVSAPLLDADDSSSLTETKK